MARYYYISKLNDQKVMRLVHDPDKDNIIFRDYSGVLEKIDHDKYAKYLEIIGTEQAKVAAAWLRLYKKYGNEGYFRPIKSNPIVHEMIREAKVYVKGSSLLIKYKDATIATCGFVYFVSHLIGDKEVLFKDAIDLLIKHNKEQLDNKEENIYTFDASRGALKRIYDAVIDLSELGTSKSHYTITEESTKNNMVFRRITEVPLSNFIKEFDANAFGEFLYKIEEDSTVKFEGDKKAIELFDKVLNQVDYSKIKNRYIRKLIRLKQKYDIFIAILLMSTFIPEKFGATFYISSSNELPKHVYDIDKILWRKKQIKELMKIKNKGVEINGFKINPDGTIRGVDFVKASANFNISFVI